MGLIIESGIPAPTGRAGYPFNAMGAGDSFLVEAEAGEASKKVITSIGASARNFARKNPGTKFSTRTVEGGVRCWRVQ